MITNTLLAAEQSPNAAFTSVIAANVMAPFAVPAVEACGTLAVGASPVPTTFCVNTMEQPLAVTVKPDNAPAPFSNAANEVACASAVPTGKPVVMAADVQIYVTPFTTIVSSTSNASVISNDHWPFTSAVPISPI